VSFFRDVRAFEIQQSHKLGWRLPTNQTPRQKYFAIDVVRVVRLEPDSPRARHSSGVLLISRYHPEHCWNCRRHDLTVPVLLGYEISQHT
jgi:hypothetical protein